MANPLQWFLALHPTIQILIVSIFLNIFGVGFLLILAWIMPTEAKFFLREKLIPGGSVLTDKDPSGQIIFRHVVSELGEGVLTNPKQTLIFSMPKLLSRNDPGDKIFIKAMLGIKDVEPVEGEDPKPLDIVEVNKEDIANFNETLKNRSILKGLRKPIFFGSSSKMIASNPDLIEQIQETQDTIYSKIKLDKIKKMMFLKPWNIDTLVELVNRSISPSDINYIFQLGFLKGQGLKPKRNLARLIIPIGLILIILFVLMIVTSGAKMPSFGIKT